jgi:WD40 repeat protein
MISSLMFLAVSSLGLSGDLPKPIEVKLPTLKGPISYSKDIADILETKCIGCHSSALAENKLNMETVAGMVKGGKRGPGIVPGKADESLLFTMAAHRVEPVMPPKVKKDLKPLTPDELGRLKVWIDSGAKEDAESKPEPAKAVEIGTLPPGVHPINAIDITTDGRRVAAGRANLVQVYEVDSGLEIIRLGGHRDIVQSVRFSPDAKRLAAGSYQYVTLWNAPTGALEKTLNGSAETIKAMVATRDGQTLITAGAEKSIRFWNLADGKNSRTISNIPVGIDAIALSRDEKLLAVAGTDGIIRVLDFADGKERHVLKGHKVEVTALVFLPDGKGLASTSVDGSALLWTFAEKAGESSTSKPIEVDAKKPIRAMILGPDDMSLIAAGDDAKVQVFSLPDGKETRSFAVSGGPILALALSRDGKSLLTGATDKHARLHDLTTSRVLATFGPHGGPIRSVDFSPKGDRVLTAGSDGGVKVWDSATGQGVIAFGHAAIKAGDPPPPVQRALFLADGRIATAADKTARTWTFEGSWTEDKPLGPHVFRVLAIDFSPDGKWIATGGGEPSRSGEVKIWEAATGKLVRSLDTLHSDTVFALRFSPDGSKLATVSADKFLKIVNIADGKELKSLEGHTHHVLAVDWKADGKQLVTGGADNVVKVWDYESGEQLRTLNPANKQITGLRWISGKALVVGSSGDASVRAWNPDNGTIPRTFTGASDYLFAVACSGDGGRVAAGGADGVLFLWNGLSGQQIQKIAPTEAK